MIDIALPVQLAKLSEQNAGFLPTGYHLRGYLSEAPTVGQTLRVARYERSRQHPDEPEVVQCAGLYVSSPVVSIAPQEDGSLVCTTRNSRWQVSQIAAPVEATP